MNKERGKLLNRIRSIIISLIILLIYPIIVLVLFLTTDWENGEDITYVDRYLKPWKYIKK